MDLLNQWASLPTIKGDFVEYLLMWLFCFSTRIRENEIFKGNEKLSDEEQFKATSQAVLLINCKNIFRKLENVYCFLGAHQKGEMPNR